MIKDVAELLQGFIDEETAKLKEYKLRHGPTIGDMYEGLSAELLHRSIPQQLNLKIVDGFITDGAEFLSGQMDCMLVRGEGEKIPFTKSYKWHVKDVLVVFEVKKNLYSKDLINSYYKLRQVSESYSKYLFDGEHKEGKKIDLDPAYKAFSQLTGIAAPSYHDREILTKENELIYTSLFMEQLTPVSIVIGYNGFSTEYGLRDGLARFIEEQGEGYGFGVSSFPQLIIGGKYSLVKGNGRPYITPMREGYWDFMLSSKDNPLLLMLEIIWTKLSEEFDIGMPWGDDLEQEHLVQYLRAKPMFSEKQCGWMLKYDEISDEILSSRSPSVGWEPVEVTSSQYVIINRLAKNDVDITEKAFIEYAEKNAGSVEGFVNSILATNYVALNGKKITLIVETIVTAIVPDGRFLVADNTGRFEAWLKNTFNL